MQLDYSTITTQFDTAPRQQIADIRDVWESIQHPASFPSKESIPLWRFVTLNGRPGRCDDIYTAVTAMTVEYDDGIVTPEQFAEAHRDDVFMAYTTWSHTEEKPRFRVILPLKTPVAWGDYKLIKNDLLALFPGCDPSSASNWQKIPTARPGYRCELNALGAGLLDVTPIVRLAKIRAAADNGLSLARGAVREASVRRSDANSTWSIEKRRTYCQDVLGPRIKERLDAIPLREGRYHPTLSFITYLASLTWPDLGTPIYSEQDAYQMLRYWMADLRQARKIDAMVHRFFGHR